MNERALRLAASDALMLSPVVLLGTLPVLHLVRTALWAEGSGAGSPNWSFDQRTMTLLARSIGIAGGAALGATLGGLCVGVPLARLPLPRRGAFTVLLLAAFAVSPYFMALGWLRGDLGSVAAAALIGRPHAVAAVLAASYLPAIALLVALAMRSLPFGWEEAGLVAADWFYVLRRIVLPHLAPLLSLSALWVFVLCLSDYAVASLLQVPTYPVEVFLLYAGAFDAVEAARACLPLLAVALASAAVLGPLVWQSAPRQWPATATGMWPVKTRETRMFAAGILVVLVTVGAWPLIGLFSVFDVPETVAALRSGSSAVGNSLATTTLAVLLALGTGSIASGALLRAPSKLRILLATLLVLPLCVPGSAFAIAWVEFSGTGDTWLREATAAFPVLSPAACIAARWGGLVALLIAGARRAVPRSPLDAARVQESRKLVRFLRVELPFVAPVALSAAAILAAVSHGASDILVMTAPPGFEVAPLRIDNLLHYGAREQAVALALTSATLAAVLLLGFAASARAAWKHLA